MAEEKILEEGTTIEVGEQSAGKTKVKQIRYIFKDPEKGWFEKEKDNVRVTKYYRTQKEAIEAAKTHVNDLQDKPEGLDVSVLPTGSVAGSPVALHPYG